MMKPMWLRTVKARVRLAWYSGMERALFPDQWEARQRNEERERLELMVGPKGCWEARQRFMVEFLQRMGLKPEHHVLDLGCGPLSAGLGLIPNLNNGHYVGIDVREQAIAEAHRLVASMGLSAKNPGLIVSSCFGATELGNRTFDYVWAAAMVYHLTDELSEECFSQAHQRIAEKGRFFCNVNTVAPEGPWDEFPFVRRPLDFYSAMADRCGMTMTSHGELSEWGYPTGLPGRLNIMLEFRRRQ